LDEELLELVEMEIRDLLSFYEYDGDNELFKDLLWWIE
jgi:translation elongation factor EF-Tu-like GTPase